MHSVAELFEAVPCPICGSREFEVQHPAKYPPDIDPEKLKQAFRASSDHRLLDQVVKCRQCEMTYVTPRLRPDLILSGYSDAEDPLFAQQNDWRIAAFRKTLRKALRRLEMDPKGKRVLDVGCAGGAFLVAARDFGFDVAGVEPSRWMAAFGRKRYGLDIRDGILTPGMFPPASFDVITLWDVIEHVPDPAQALAVIHDLLKPGGYLFVNYPDIASIAARLLGKRWPFWLSVHLLYYTPKTITRQLEQAGFSPLWRQPFWAILPLGYVAQRAAPYGRLFAPLPKMIRAVGLQEFPLQYNIGQTLVVSQIR